MKFLLFKFILGLTALLPLRLIHWLGNIIGQLSWLSHSRLRRIASRNIQLCLPELSTEQQTQLVKQTLKETGKVILETGKMWRGDTESTLALVRDCENQQLVDDALAQKRGVILAMPHYGSWELTGLYCARHYPMTTLYAPQADARVELLIQQARQRTGARLVPTDNNGIRALSRALKQGKMISILPDQSPRSNGVFAPFFGRSCYTMTLLSKLASKTGACVIYACARRYEDSSGFKLVFRAAEQDLSQLPLQQSVEAVNRDIEALIREVPQQYQWTYKRFKQRPPGEPPIY